MVLANDNNPVRDVSRFLTTFRIKTSFAIPNLAFADFTYTIELVTRMLFCCPYCAISVNWFMNCSRATLNIGVFSFRATLWDSGLYVMCCIYVAGSTHAGFLLPSG